MKLLQWITLLFLFPSICLGEGFKHPFDYDLNLFSIPGKTSRTMVCLHGFGSSYKVAYTIKNLKDVDVTIVSFNFPDYNILQRGYSLDLSTFGTIKELLPPLYVLKKYIVEQGLEFIDLYGFSAGGGAAVNILAVLNSSLFDEELQKIGIGNQEKKQILTAIQKGIVVLDTPLKSIEEIIELRGYNPGLDCVAQRYRENDLRPIDSLNRLEGLSLNVIVHFQEKDEVIFNRDDNLYIERLQQVNRLGTTTVVIQNDGGHIRPHYSLWKVYLDKVRGDALMGSNQ